jgi:hypothetical protein
MVNTCLDPAEALGKQNEQNMKNLKDKIQTQLTAMNLMLGLKLLLVVVLIVLVVLLARWLFTNNSIAIGHNDRIEVTPVQIERIRSIGEWEFLSISDEEMVDTVRHGFFGDDELSRIYYGTLRLGIDLSETKKEWLSVDKDTVKATLPPIKLLDENFLDEARTRTFYEEGKWSEADKADLTRRAHEAMKRRCLTLSNIKSAENNASAQFTKLLNAMGFEFVKVRFREK